MIKQKERFLGLALILGLLSVLAGCSNVEEDNAAPAAKPAVVDNGAPVTGRASTLTPGKKMGK